MSGSSMLPALCAKLFLRRKRFFGRLAPPSRQVVVAVMMKPEQARADGAPREGKPDDQRNEQFGRADARRHHTSADRIGDILHGFPHGPILHA